MCDRCHREQTDQDPLGRAFRSSETRRRTSPRNCREFESAKKLAEQASYARVFRALRVRCYCLFVLFLGSALAVFFFILPSRPPIRVKASSALNGNWRTDDWPVVLNVISTRRSLDSTIVRMFLSAL